MADLPLLGAALRVDEIAPYRDWLSEAPRPLEVHGLTDVTVLRGDWKAAAAAAREVVSGFPGPLGIHGPASVTLGSDDPDVRTLAQKRLDQGLDVCAELGATQMVIHSPYTYWDHDNLDNVAGRREEKLAAFRQTLDAAVRRAESLGVELVVENIEDRDPTIRKSVVAHYNSSALKLSIDTGHAYYAHKRVDAPAVDRYVQAAGENLAHMHLQDGDGFADRHWGVAEGAIPWRAIFDELALLTTKPRLVIELRKKARVKTSAEYLVAQGLAQ